MKKLLLFCLLASLPAFGQAYSTTAMQNSNGNYSRAVPFAPVTVCASSDLNVPCTTKVTTYTDQTLTVACTLSANGVGAGTSGANCNNPGASDANGNFTLYLQAGVYRMCVYAQNYQCVTISMGGAGGPSFLLRTNSPNGTFQGQLVTYDCAHIDANGFCEVQNAAVNAKNVIGSCIAGCGTTGIATISTYLSAPLTLDGPGTPGDVVSPSGSVAGFGHDEGATTAQAGVQTVGRISKANSGGAGTQAQVDFFLGDLTSPGAGGNAQITPCTTAGCMIFEPTANQPTITGDNFILTNGSGNGTVKSWSFTGPGAFFFTGAQGTAPSPAPSNSIQFQWPTTISTPNTWIWPQATGSSDVGKAWGVASETTDGNGNPVDTMGLIASGAGTVTSITASSPIVVTPSPLTSTGVISCPTCTTGSPIRGLSFTLRCASGLVAQTTDGACTTTYLTIPFGCTIQAYNLAIDTGTITVKFWKVATGTAIPTSTNSISTSGVSIASGTAIHSTTLTDFTTTTVTANDIMALDVTAVSSATFINGVLQCQ